MEIILAIIALVLILILVLLWKIYQLLGGSWVGANIYEELQRLSANFADFYSDKLKEK